MKKNCLKLILIMFLLISCGDKVSQNIKKLTSPDNQVREEARLELILMKENATPRLVKLLLDKKTSLELKKELVTLLFRIQLREETESIEKAFITILETEKNLELLSRVAKACGELEEKAYIPALLKLLKEKQKAELIYQLLCSLQILEEKLTSEQRQALISSCRELNRQALNEETKAKIAELTESEVEKLIAEGDKFLLQAQFEEAHQKYSEAQALSPKSKLVNQRLGRYWFDQGKPLKAYQVLKQGNNVFFLKKLSKLPKIDGDLEPLWLNSATRVTGMVGDRARPPQAQTVFYLGYTRKALYVAVKAEEPYIKEISAKETNPWQVWRDDCIELFFDINHTYSNYYQLIINTKGVIGSNKDRYEGWSPKIKTATKLYQNYWVMEIEIPFREFKKARIRKNTVWGVNLARNRNSRVSEYTQWAYTGEDSHRPDRFGFMVFE
jgi:hypothetical protein